MVKILTKDLKGRALDYMTAKALGLQAWVDSGRNCEDKLVGYPMHRSQGLPSNISSAFSTSWAQMGPFIELLGISLIRQCPDRWVAEFSNGCGRNDHGRSHGPIALTAACRCVVLSYAGEEVEVPDELT